MHDTCRVVLAREKAPVCEQACVVCFGFCLLDFQVPAGVTSLLAPLVAVDSSQSAARLFTEHYFVSTYEGTGTPGHVARTRALCGACLEVVVVWHITG